jgi:hypothetical protein
LGGGPRLGCLPEPDDVARGADQRRPSNDLMVRNDSSAVADEL